MPSVQSSSECSRYEAARLERPMWQLQAVTMPRMNCAIRQQLSCSIAGSRLPQMPCGLGFYCTCRGISPPNTSITCTGNDNMLQSSVTCSRSSKGSQISPRYAEVVVKQLDPRWARKGVTTALLQAAGYSADVAVKTEFVGDLPAHLSCWSDHLGRSDVTVAKVAAPASDPSLRKLPRSIQFQGLSVSMSVSRSLQNKHEQRKATAADTPGKQARRKAKKVKRQASKQKSGQQQASSPQQQAPPPHQQASPPACSQPVVQQQEVVPDDEPLLEATWPLPGGCSLPTVEGSPAALARLHPAPSSAAEGLGTPMPVASLACVGVPDAASPLAGKRRGPESMSDAESSGTTEAPTADSLALVPLTPDDSHAPSLRRSSREHKKPRPYYTVSPAEPPDKPSTSKGLQRGFLK